MRHAKHARIRSSSHLLWVRHLPCAVIGCAARGECDPAHVRRGTDGGTGLKPSDCWVVPLCHSHHVEQHQVGELAFERRHGVALKALAERVWAVSPHNRSEGAAREAGV